MKTIVLNLELDDTVSSVTININVSSGTVDVIRTMDEIPPSFDRRGDTTKAIRRMLQAHPDMKNQAIANTTRMVPIPPVTVEMMAPVA